MNEFVRIAQADPAGAGTGQGPQILAIVQPSTDSLSELTRVAGQVVDFTAILQADVSFFRINNTLQIFFADGSSVVVYDFFGGDQTAETLILGDGVEISVDRFISLASVQEVNEIQTAAGPTTSLDALLGPDGPGANFEPTEIDDLGPGLGLIGLLGPNGFGRSGGGSDEAPDGEADSFPSIAFPADAGALNESNLPEGTLAGGPLIVSGDLGIDFAEDGDLGRTLEFDVDQSGIPVDQDDVPFDLTSDGIALAYTIIDNDDGGQTLTATRNGDIVFTVTLFPNGAVNGSYTFTLVDNLDHIQPQNDASLLISFGFTAGDFDGDTIGSEFGITIFDDQPILDDADVALVDEDDLSTTAPQSDEASGVGDASAGDDDIVTDGDLETEAVDTDPTSVRGNLNIVFGADNTNSVVDGGTSIGNGDRAVTFSDDAISELEALSLTSHGTTLAYAVSGNGTVLTATADGRTIFTVTLSDQDTGSYVFDLNDVLDHSESDTEDDIVLSFGYEVTDSDGDRATSSFDVTVDDDLPVIGDAESALADEDDLATGAPQDDEVDGVGDRAAGDDDVVTNAGLETAAGDTDPSTVRGDLAINFGADDGNGAVDGGVSTGNGDRAVTFSASATAALQALDLTSHGQALTYAVTGNGTVLTATADGRTIFTVTLSDQDTGSYVFDLNDVLDHSTSDAEDNIVLTFGFIATDSDGDTATSSFDVAVDDDLPAIGDAEAALVDEDDLATGAPQDDEADGIGDAAFGDDATATNAGLETAASDTDPTTVRGDLAINFGADDNNAVVDGGVSTGNGDRAVTFSSGAIAALQALDLTSQGQDLAYAVTGNGTILTATADGRTIFSVTLSDQGTGSYVFDLNDVLDHSTSDTEDDIFLTIGFTATDSDGDSVTSTFNVTVDDDVPVIGTFDGEEEIGPEGAAVDEDDLSTARGDEATGNDDGRPRDFPTITNDTLDTDNDPTTVAGSLNVQFGADDGNSVVNGGASNGNGDRSITFAANIVATLENLGLTSQGQAIRYGLNDPLNDFLTATSADGRIVFTVELFDSGSGSYLFDLNDVVDHPDVTREDLVIIDFGIVATDSDGDTAAGSFSVFIDDDSPVIGAPQAARVDEDDLAMGPPQGDEADGNADSADGDDDPITNMDLEAAAGDSDPSTVRGNLDISFGADDGNRFVDGGFSAGNGDRAVTFSPGAIAALQALDLRSHGESLTYTETGNGTILTASAGGRTIFTVTLSDQETGSYVFDLNDVLDHPGEGPEDNILLTFDFTVTDSDGDTATGRFEVDIDDDLPVIVAPEAGLVDEDGLFTGNSGDSYPDPFSGRGSVGDLPGDRRSTTGSLGISWGADDDDRFDIDGQDSPFDSDRSVTLSDFGTAANNIVDANGVPLALTSNGVALVYSILDEGTVLTARAGPSGPLIFRVELLDDGTGSYNFILAGNLDHPGNDIEDNLEFFVRFTATDSDGDTASSSFSVTVNDDAPVIGAPASTLVDEDDLPGGVGDMAAGDDVAVSFEGDGLATTVGGSLDIAWGADDGDDETVVAGPGNRSVAFSDLASAVNNVTVTDSTGAAIDLGAGDLTSDGELVSFTLIDGQTLVAFTGETPPTSVGEASVVFHVALSDDLDGSYLFTLVRKLDHPLQDDPDGGGDDAFEDNLNFTFGFTATDSDGDSADSAFAVSIDDDIPAVTGAPVLGVVDETVLADIPPDEQTLDFNNPAEPGGPDYTVTAGSVSGGSALSTLGVPVTIIHNDGSVFTLNSLSLSSSFSFFPVDAQITGLDANGVPIAQASLFGFTSFLFDASNPQFATFDGARISELRIIKTGNSFADLQVNNVALAVPGIPGEPSIDTQDLSTLIADGADEPANFALKTFDALDFGAVTAFGGQQVRIVSDGTTLTAFVDDGNAPGDLDSGDTQVFTLTLNPQGAAEFTLLQELDHNLGPQLDLDFGPLIDVTDTDGDTIPLNSGDYVVTVNSPGGGQPPVAIDDPGIGGESVTINASGFQTPIPLGGVTTTISDTSVEAPLSGFDISSTGITFTASRSGFSNFLVFTVDADSDFTGFSTPTGSLAPFTTVSLTATGNFTISVNSTNLVAGVSTFSFDFTTDRVIGVDVNTTSGNLHDLLLTNDSDPNGDPIDIVGIDTTGTTGSVFFDDATDTLQYTASGFSLGAGEQVIDTFTYTLTDRNGGIDTATVSITVTGDGQNTPAIIAGEDTGIVVEDTTLSVSGVLTVTDPDPGEAVFVAASGLVGAFGTLEIDANGNWTYLLDNDLAAVQALNDGESLADAITVQTADGTTHQIDIAIQGIDEGGGDAVPLVLRIEQNGADQFHSFLPVDRLFFEGWQLTLNNAPVEINVLNSDNVTSITSDGFEFDAGEGTRFIELELSDAAPASGTINLTFDYSAFDVLAFGFFPLGRVNDGEGPVFSLQSGGTSAEIQSYASDSDYIGFHNYESRTISFNYSVAAGIITITNLIDPIVLDLGAEGYSFATAENGVEFDLDSDGESDSIAWTNAEDGLLAIDLDGSGAIEDGSELFTPTFGGGSFASSLDALASLDGNGDGRIDEADEAFADLLVWVDENSDGISQAHEITSLADNGIASIALDAANRAIQIDGQNVVAEGSFTLESGETRSYVAVEFAEAPESAGQDDPVASSTPNEGVDEDLLAEGLASGALGNGATGETFLFDELATAFKLIEDFDVSNDADPENDVIDIGQLLDDAFGGNGGFVDEAETSDYLRITQTGSGGARVAIDTDGGGDAWTDIAVINGVMLGETIRVVLDEDGTQADVAVA